MSNESSKTRAELAKVRTAYPEAFVWKINDRVRVGIPDTLIVYRGASIWIEFKDMTKRPRPMSRAVTPLQRQTMMELAVAGSDVYVASFHPEGLRFHFVAVDGTFAPSGHTNLVTLVGGYGR